MNPLLQLLAKHAAKGRDGTFTLLLCAGVWLANEVRHDTATIRSQLAAIEARQTQTDQRLSRLENLAIARQ